MSAEIKEKIASTTDPNFEITRAKWLSRVNNGLAILSASMFVFTFLRTEPHDMTLLTADWLAMHYFLIVANREREIHRGVARSNRS